MIHTAHIWAKTHKLDLQAANTLIKSYPKSDHTKWCPVNDLGSIDNLRDEKGVK